MSPLNDTDYLLIERNGIQYHVSSSDMSNLHDTDLLLVERDGVQYKMQARDLSLGPNTGSVDITPLTITPSTTPQNITVTTGIQQVNGSIPADVTYNWYQYDDATTSTGQTLIRTATGRASTDQVQLPADADEKYIGCTVSYLNIDTPETTRCAVDAWPPVQTVDVQFVLIAGGGLSHGVGRQSRAGGGAGGYLSNVPGENSGGGDSALPTLTLVTDDNTYEVTIGAAGSNSSLTGPLESVSIPNPPTPPNYTAIAGGYSNGSTTFGGGSGGGGASDTGNAIGAAGTAGQGFDGGGSTTPTSACFKEKNSCHSACYGDPPGSAITAFGAGGGAGTYGGHPDTEALNNSLGRTFNSQLMCGGHGVQSSITGTATWYAGGGRSTQSCDGTTYYGVDGLGADSYGGGGSVDNQTGNDGVLILRYPRTVDITNPGGGLTMSTIQIGEEKVTTITAGFGNIKFVNP